VSHRTEIVVKETSSKTVRGTRQELRSVARSGVDLYTPPFPRYSLFTAERAEKRGLLY